jgi:hypothetical protein
MKVLLGFFALILVALSCDKKQDKNTDVLSNEDLITSQNMESELVSMQQALDNLRAATNNADRIYWDNLYHHHDSLFWVHHDHYHHEHYNHDDHHHQWLSYDPNIDHHHHYHHPFPNHPNDSLATTPNNHHHDNHDHHFPGHDLNHHHVLDSLHVIHNSYHP